MLCNGVNLTLTQPLPLAEFLRRQGFRPELVAVELNGSIIGRAAFAQVLLTDADKLEIVSFVGGG